MHLEVDWMGNGTKLQDVLNFQHQKYQIMMMLIYASLPTENIFLLHTAKNQIKCQAPPLFKKKKSWVASAFYLPCHSFEKSA